MLQSANGGREMDKTATVNPIDEAVRYEATVDRYIAGMELLQTRMAEDQQEIENLQAETRAMLADIQL